MKDQHQVLHKCLTEDVPAFVLTGKDVCAIATLKTYLQTAIEEGCSDEFVNDMVLVLREFDGFSMKNQKSEDTGLIGLCGERVKSFDITFTFR
ncbi:MAG: hypothetical protein ACLU4J_21635 [Butyricimonas paravirosa]